MLRLLALMAVPFSFAPALPELRRYIPGQCSPWISQPSPKLSSDLLISITTTNNTNNRNTN